MLKVGRIVFHTKGIANDAEDPLVYEDQIYGVVQTKLNIVTKLNGVINNMYGMYFLIIIPLAIIVFSEFRSSKNDYIDDEEEEEEDDDENIKKRNKKEDKKIKKRKEKRAKRRRRYE